MSKINPQKMLPSPKGGPIVKSSKGSIVPKDKFVVSRKKINFANLTGKQQTQYSESLEKDVDRIRVSVISIEKMLKGSFLLQKKDEERRRKRQEKEEFETREKNLEKKPSEKEMKKSAVSVPKLGIFGVIKRFIVNTILGFLAYRLIEYLPQAIKFASVVLKAADFIIDFGGKLLDGLVTFIDWGYKAYDATRGFVKNIFGEGGVKLFDKFSDALKLFINLSIIAGLASMRMGGMGGGKGGLKGPGGKPSFKPGVGGRPKVTTSGGRGQGRPDIRNPLRQRPTVTTGQGGKPGGFRFPGSGPRITGSGSGGILGRASGFFKNIKIPRFNIPPGVSKAMNVAGRSLGYVALIPAVMEVVGALKDGRHKDAIRTIVRAGLSMVVFNAILGASGAAAVAETVFSGGLATPAAIATLVGGTALAAGGAIATDVATDALLKKLGLEDKQPQAMAGGGPVTPARGGKKFKTGVKGKRTFKKPKRYLTRSPKKPDIRPGKDIGGKEKLFGIFPNPFAGLFGKKAEKPKEEPDTFGFMQRTSERYSKIEFFGPMMTLASTLMMGQKPTPMDYENVALGINSLISKGMKDGKLKGGVISGFAEGGPVSPDISSGDADITKWVEMSVRDSVSREVDDVTRDLMRNVMLKKVGEEGPDKSDPTLQLDDGVEGGGMTKGQWGPLLDLIAGKESGGNYEAMYPSTTLKGATKMTIAEVARRATGAVGKYQQLPQYLVGRAKAAGLNPDKDLYSPENQEKIIINVNIKGRGGEKWLKGQISDEQFMQGLSQEFASLPNAQGKFYYPGQSSAMTPQKVKAALAKVKKGGYSKQELASYDKYQGSAGQIGGSGKFIQGNSGNSRGVHFHIGPGSQVKGTILQSQYNADARASAAKVVDYFLKKGSSVYDGRRGVYYKSSKEVAAAQKAHTASGSQGGIDLQVDFEKPVPFPLKTVGMAFRPNGFGVSADIEGSNSFVAHGRYDEKGKIAPQTGGLKAYAKGGPTLSVPHTALIGEKGREYVIDADSYAATEKVAPGLFDILNYDVSNKESLKKNMGRILGTLNQFAPYELGASPTVVIDDSEDTPEMSGMGGQSGGLNISGGSDNSSSYDPFSKLYAIG